MQTANDTDRLPRVSTSPYDTWQQSDGAARPPVVSTQPDVTVGPAQTPPRQWHRSWGSELIRWAIVIAVWVPLTVGLLLGSLFGAIYWQSRHDQARPVEAIVVLGAAQYDGRPTPVLQARLDHVLELYRAGIAPVIVVTGGKQEGDRFTEAEASRDFLVSEGVPERDILLENQGRSSWESMQGAKRLLAERGLSRVLLVSDGFHLLRLKVMARELGLTPFASPATSSPIEHNSRTEVDYMVREGGGILAFLTQHTL